MSEALAMNVADDQAILRRVAAGDPAALRTWYDGQKHALYAFVFYRVGGDAALAEDATQSTFTAALENLSNFDPDRGDMKNWLRYLSRNIIRKTLADFRRGEQLQQAWEEIDGSLRAAYERIDRELLPEEVLERDETRELVLMTLSNLPPNYRDVLAAKYIQGQSLQAIANAGETTVDAVKAMLRRARAAFRECFLALAKLEVSDV